jgi:hypothetical protein
VKLVCVKVAGLPTQQFPVVVVAVYDRVPPPTLILAAVAKALAVKLAINNKHARRVNIALKSIKTFLEQ